MTAIDENKIIEDFLDYFAAKNPVFFKENQRTIAASKELFYELAGPMLHWASVYLGEGFEDVLIKGYCKFVLDVNRSQIKYERDRQYPNKSYAQVYQDTYNHEEFMNYYHWGVYVTTFAWGHHLEIYRMFRDSFLLRLAAGADLGSLLDLGCGSGIWHMLALRQLPQWHATAVDISETSLKLCQEMGKNIFPETSLTYVCGDALTFRPQVLFDAGISCFLMEHLENPVRLLENLASCLKEHAYCFVTCALTAAEIDHIHEFRHESDLVLLAEKAGFRVIEMLSSAPETLSADRYFLPRSLAMVLQKRKGDIW